MALTPGEQVLLQMTIGDQVLRHGVVVSDSGGTTSHHVLTPSGAIKLIDFSAAGVKRIIS